ncbi:uncharacterized protein LOC130690482 [Daphnia carinata]|uniref:uncharacterized protein LOC130690482 n=1 Tax=Daphnia carinata TaxID=120202 RepID=UPI00257DA61F|nr:uncharacterized protein LOC130690482 [Daphnia carinata]
MRSRLSILMLICLQLAITLQPSQSSVHHPPSFKLKELIHKGLHELEALHEKHATGKAVIQSRKFGLGIKAILLKPLLLIALAKIKLALLLGKPFALLALKKLLLKAALGKLLLKIPLILLGGKAVILAKVLALKFALVTKGLIGLKAPLALLFLGGFLKGAIGGSGLGLALGFAGSLLKLKGLGASEEEYDEPSYTYLPPPPPSVYSGPAPYSYAPVYDAPAPLYSNGGSLGNSFATGYENNAGGFTGGYENGRRKRDVVEENDSEEEFDSEEDSSEESPEELRLEFEAARTNGNAYLYMAAQFDEQSCGRRLMCEVYQKSQHSLTEDEKILRNIFGYPMSPLNEEDRNTPKESYYRAAQIGASQQGRANNQICARFYSTCPHNAEQLIRIFIADDNANDIETGHLPFVQQRPQTSARLPFYHQRQPSVSPVARLAHNQQLHVKTAQQQVRRPTEAPVRQRLVSPAAV